MDYPMNYFILFIFVSPASSTVPVTQCMTIERRNSEGQPLVIKYGHTMNSPKLILSLTMSNLQLPACQIKEAYSSQSTLENLLLNHPDYLLLIFRTSPVQTHLQDMGINF